jgi:hypothetical protein
MNITIAAMIQPIRRSQVIRRLVANSAPHLTNPITHPTSARNTTYLFQQQSRNPAAGINIR